MMDWSIISTLPHRPDTVVSDGRRDLVARDHTLAPQPDCRMARKFCADQLGSAQRGRLLVFSLCSDVGRLRHLSGVPGSVRRVGVSESCRSCGVVVDASTLWPVQLVYRGGVGGPWTYSGNPRVHWRVYLLSACHLQEAIESQPNRKLSRRCYRPPPKGSYIVDIREIRLVADLPQRLCGKRATIESPSSAP
jgi:hypothetical protein